MLLIDDILLSPIHGLLWVFQEIHHAGEAAVAGEAETITSSLSELYMMLETGQMTEAEFDAAEKVLLDRLDVVKARAASAQPDEADDADDTDDDDADDDEDPVAGD